MATIISHPAVPLSIYAIVGQRLISWRLLVVGMLASTLPDIDVIGFRLGIPYGDIWGHRGLTHSLLFALGVGLIAACAAPWLRANRLIAGLFVFLACSSHGLLDMCTTGGKGVAYLWPYSGERYFLPYQVIKVSTLSLSRFFGPEGLLVLQSEWQWVWLPAIAIGLIGWGIRKILAKSFCKKPM
jgi:inner membrane protein